MRVRTYICFEIGKVHAPHAFACLLFDAICMPAGDASACGGQCVFDGFACEIAFRDPGCDAGKFRRLHNSSLKVLIKRP